MKVIKETSIKISLMIKDEEDVDFDFAKQISPNWVDSFDADKFDILSA